MELSAATENEYFHAVCFSYVGRAWIVYSIFRFITDFIGIKIPKFAVIIAGAVNVLTSVIVATTRKTGLYYSHISFSIRNKFPVLNHDNGIWHHIWNTWLVMYVLAATLILFLAIRKEKKEVARKRLKMVFMAVLTQGIFLCVQLTGLLPITKFYDVTMLSFPVAAVFMLIAILRYSLLDSGSLAKDYVVDKLSEAILMVDDDKSISYFNQPALSLFPRIKLEEKAIVEALGNAVKDGEPIGINRRIYTVEANLLSNNKMVAGTIYSLTDDTDHYRYLEELEEQKKKADEANRAKSSFLANMSHEIRTPINAVLGMDEMILRESEEKSIRSYARDIKIAGKTLLSLVNDILDFSKIEEGKMEILPTQYELSSVINDLINMIRSKAEKKGLKVELDVDPEVPHILYGDEIRIKQVITNLLTNAVKYTHQGKVTLQFGFNKLSEKQILLSVKVSDTGIGIKEEDMEKLFSPFSRIDEKKNRSVEGTGLGMSIVRQLLDLMDSKLEVKSVYGEGSEFSFEIKQDVIRWDPMGDMTARFTTEEVETDAYQELFHAPDAHILVVDDTEVNLTVFQNLLKKTEADIDVAISGRTALAMAAAKQYDVIFIDHMMPDMDGIETLNRLKENSEYQAVYIALTANAVSGAREMYLEAGFADYMSKPIDGSKLEKMVRKYIPKDKILSVSVSSPKTNNAALLSAGENKILVVDDDEVICAAANQILGADFNVISCNDGKSALSVARKEHPELILLDINLGGVTGFEVLQMLKEDTTVRDIPVMFITADEDREKESLGLKNGALDFIRKPFIPEVLLQRSKRIISLYRFQNDLKGEVRKQSRRAERLTKEMMVALSHTVDAKDHYTKGHSERVATYAAEIGRRMGKSPDEQVKLYEIGLLHDIGKIGIPEEIINKTSRLTDEEFAKIKEHTVIGNNILRDITDMPELCFGSRSHHERYDGSGYPDGLKGDAIPEIARIICIADCYDAMTSTRTYSEPKPQQKVRDEIVRCSGSQFDPVIAQIMLAMIDEDTEYRMNERGSDKSIWKGYAQFWETDLVRNETVSSDEGKEDEAVPDWLNEVPELDIGSGIANCGSGESFLSVLKVFHQTAEQKAAEIRQLYDEGDIENYTIKVHALKSSARIIGAADLSDKAKQLEAAGKSGDLDYIHTNTAQLLEDYIELDSRLKALDTDDKDLEELSEAMRKEAFQTIGEIADSMDFGMMEQVLNDVKGYRLSEEDRGNVKKIEEMLMQLDWDGIIEVVKGVTQ